MTAYSRNSKSALIVEGDGMTGIFSAGVLDAFMESDFNPYQIFLGASTGAMNISTFLSRMMGKNFLIYSSLMTGKSYNNTRRFLSGGDWLDVDWLFQEIEANRYVTQADRTAGQEFYIVATCVETGLPLYLSPGSDDIMQALKASIAMPGLCRNFIKFRNREYCDGTISDPIPVIEAYRRGARNITVIRSHLQDEGFQENFLLRNISKHFLREKQFLKQALERRVRAYKRAQQFIKNPPEGVKITEIAPESRSEAGAFSKNKRALQADFETGLEAGRRFVSQNQQSELSQCEPDMFEDFSWADTNEALSS